MRLTEIICVAVLGAIGAVACTTAPAASAGGRPRRSSAPGRVATAIRRSTTDGRPR